MFVAVQSRPEASTCCRARLFATRCQSRLGTSPGTETRTVAASAMLTIMEDLLREALRGAGGFAIDVPSAGSLGASRCVNTKPPYIRVSIVFREILEDFFDAALPGLPLDRDHPEDGQVQPVECLLVQRMRLVVGLEPPLRPQEPTMHLSGGLEEVRFAPIRGRAPRRTRGGRLVRLRRLGRWVLPDDPAQSRPPSGSVCALHV